jgi:hypothetical protein
LSADDPATLQSISAAACARIIVLFRPESTCAVDHQSVESA